jgi:hypothetical protein
MILFNNFPIIKIISIKFFNLRTNQIKIKTHKKYGKMFL